MVDAIRIFPELPEQANGKAKAATAEFSGTPVDDSDVPF
jgi:hypothetical protein